MKSRIQPHPSRRPWILDGPMGTELARRGGDTSLPLWSARALLESPELVRQIHIDYLKAGAEIITTNTFRTQFRTLKRAGLGHQANRLTELAVNLAIEAKNATNKNVLIAGSIAPLEDCYSPELVPTNNELEQEHGVMASWLINADIDFFLIETMNTVREAVIAVNSTQKYDIPIWLSLTCDNAGQILSGEEWDVLIEKTRDNVDVYLVNCTSLEGTTNAMRKLFHLNIDRIGCYPNFGAIDPITGWAASSIPESFYNFIYSCLELHPFAVGTCCGAIPDTTAKLIQLINKNQSIS